MSYRYEVDNTKKYNNIIVEKRYKDDVLKGYRFTASNGYSIEDVALEYDENGNEIETKNYTSVIYAPAKYNFNNFTYKAVKESEIDNVLS